VALAIALMPGHRRWPIVQAEAEAELSDSGITIEVIEAAERLMGVSYTLAERQLMLDNLDGQIEAARARRALAFDNDLPMASRFDPRLPGFAPLPRNCRCAPRAPIPGRCPSATRTSPSPR